MDWSTVTASLSPYLSVITPFAIALFSSFVTVQLTKRQFYSQKWWEKKAEAYSLVIEKLALLRRTFRLWFEDGIGERQLDEAASNDLRRVYREAREAIEIAEAKGSYILSEKATQELTKFLKQLETDNPDPIDDLDSCAAATSTCIRVMRQLAKDDLHLGPGRLARWAAYAISAPFRLVALPWRWLRAVYGWATFRIKQPRSDTSSPATQ